MSTLPTLAGVTKNLISNRWKEALIGALALVLASVMMFVGNNLNSMRDKVNSLPEASQIATVSSVNQRFVEQEKKIDANEFQTQQSLGRIEGKIDTLIMAMATRPRRAMATEDPDYAARGTPSTPRTLPDI